MSAFPDDIRNLSAVLDSLLTGVCAIQQPLMRLVIDHLRLLASQMDQEFPAQRLTRSQTPPATPVSPAFSIFARACQTVETRYDQ